MSDMPDDPWPLRPWLLGGLGLLCGSWFYALGKPPLSDLPPRLIAMLGIAPGLALFAFAFTVERARWRWSLCFSLCLGVLMALLSYWAVGAKPDVTWQFESQVIAPRLSAGALFALLAIPFFQAMQDEPRLHHRLWQLPYSRLHDHAWTNAVLVPAAFIFMGLVGLLLILWAQLFKLIGVNFFADMFEKGWFLWPVLTAAWLVGVALLRDWPRVVLPLRRMTLVILSVLAPALAAIALLWIIFLPFTGLAPLWATGSATPILLLVMAFALLLANAIIRDDAADEPKSATLRLSGKILGAAMLPLGGIAAISLALRINQYGWTPERCYAALFILIALLYAVSYIGLLATRWRRWSDAIRPANIKLALGVMTLALLVSTPLMDVERLSVNSQMARLMSGQTKVADFDFAALKFHMGEVGLAAMAKLRSLPTSDPKAAAIKAELAMVDKVENYWSIENETTRQLNAQESAELAATFEQRFALYPKTAKLPDGLKAAILNDGPSFNCAKQGQKNVESSRCAMVLADFAPGGPLEAMMLSGSCARCYANATLWLKQGNDWISTRSNAGLQQQASDKIFEALDAGRYAVITPPFKILQIDGQSIVIDPTTINKP
jgi:hypothetical protein